MVQHLSFKISSQGEEPYLDNVYGLFANTCVSCSYYYLVPFCDASVENGGYLSEVNYVFLVSNSATYTFFFFFAIESISGTCLTFETI